ncbi:oxidoreductase [Gloeocapsopsis dulcis]|uniref:Short-chain dehydrogenase/reductase n=2 Tax=Gloeocapsopsis TaxID=693222 RepID=A0A6N8FYH5_9CHRO|nr:oxidoreductase [Gloeocapsopsis dulcis]MUL37899.1 short-chain dehydrogenase/reductase [Gloeocapsopsis dulcis AAB1 = 1H9]WNN92353.1 oxidoreductase [Gloeocapsopsis dulcis]
MMTSPISKQRVWFITGTSSGLGRALAEAVLEKGEAVVLTARNPEKVEDLAAKFPDRAIAAQLDITKPEEVKKAVEKAIDCFGRIDVLVNNAGVSTIGAIEEVSDEEVRRLFETNFFGVLEMLRTVLPHMRQQRSGHILNVSSIGCFSNSTAWGFYNSSKLAVEGISGTLANEVVPLGIKVTIVEPGAFRTDFIKRSVVLTDTQIEDYKPSMGNMRQNMWDHDFNALGDPKKAALAMIKVVDSDNPPIRLALGADTVETVEAALQFIKAELDTWKEVSISTDFDEVVADKIQVAS